MKKLVEYQTTIIRPNLIKGVIEKVVQPIQTIEPVDSEFYFYGNDEATATLTVRVSAMGRITQFLNGSKFSSSEMTLGQGQRVTFTDLTKEISFWLAEVPEVRPKGF